MSKKSGSKATYSIRQCSTAASNMCHSFEIDQNMLNGIDIANMTIKGHFFIPKDFLQEKNEIYLVVIIIAKSLGYALSSTLLVRL